MTADPATLARELALVATVQRAARGEAPRVAGDAAFEQLVAMHRGLIWREVRRYSGRGVEDDDLHQAALLGFWRGIQDFDPTRGVRLTTYAQHWVRERVRKTHGSTRTVVYLPTHVREQARLDAKAGGSAVSRFMAALCHAESFDAPAHDDGFETKGDRFADPIGTIDARIIDHEQRERAQLLIDRALAAIKPRYAEVLRRRILTSEPETLDAIGTTWGVTREAVRNTEGRAIRAFRAWVMQRLDAEDRAALGVAERTPRTNDRKAKRLLRDAARLNFPEPASAPGRKAA